MILNFKRKEKVQTKKKEKPPKKLPTIKVGTHKKLTIALWILLACSLIFAVYKNFTAIDIHTVHEREVVEEKILDTNGIEVFTEAFAHEYFSWQQGQEAVDSRNERLREYLTEELQQLNTEMLQADVPTTSAVQKVQIWSVSEAGDGDYKVIFSVTQHLTENEVTNPVVATYHVMVHVDESGNFIITRNPTMDRQPVKSGYEPKRAESDGTVSAEQSEEITNFLETFFRLYPRATEEELTYYVKDNALPVVEKNYIFVELVNPVYIIADDRMKVDVTVKYLDQETKTVQFAQYDLTLEKQDNWKIVK